MPKPEQTQEPSIEEILASIRRIIADDGAQTKAAASEPFPRAPRADFPGLAASPHRPVPVRRDPYEPEEPAEPFGEAEILELTEDFIVEDLTGEMHRAEDERAFSPETKAVKTAPAIEKDDPSGLPDPAQGLASVLSNVAAEVERLSSGKQTASNLSGPFAGDDWDSASGAGSSAGIGSKEDRPHSHPQAAPATPAQPRSYRKAEAPPARTAPPPARPVWSARHLENDGARPKPAEVSRPAPRKPAETPARTKAVMERASWADGIQMPVPESGPAAPPFQMPLGEDEDATPPLSGSGEARPDIEKERSFVGDVLTRVFGQSKPQDEPARQPADGVKSTAETLAKSAISDFAAEKLGAPAIADALHADKPFMEAVAGSLETALAKADLKAASDYELTPRQPSEQSSDELPEALLPPEPDGEPLQPPEPIYGAPFAADPLIASTVPVEPGPTAAAKHAPARPDKAIFPESRPESHDPDFEAPAQFEQRPAADSETNAAAQSWPGAAAAQADLDLDDVENAAAPSLSPDRPMLTAELPSGLEEAVKELIKPLIVQWLNENLPRIVEKAVREEIAEQALGPVHHGNRRT